MTIAPEDNTKSHVLPLLFDLRYLLRPRWDTGVSPPELIDFIQTHRPGTALDLGCGTGTNVLTLARSGWRTTGVDFSRLAIERARRRIRRAGLACHLLIGDVTRTLNLSGPFDLVLDLGCFHMLGDPLGYLKNLVRLLPDGGHWLTYGFICGSSALRAAGLSPQLLDSFAAWGLDLVQRQDGSFAGRPSAWFLFARQSLPAPIQDHAVPEM